MDMMSSRRPIAAWAALLVAAGLAFAPGLGQERKANPALAALVPRVEGWTEDGAPRSFFPETLYEYIDGAAENYLSYDFKELLVVDLKKAGGAATLTVEVYDMGLPANAFGIFGAERYPENGPVAVGDLGYLEGESLNFMAGRYYVKLLSFGLKEATAATLSGFGEKLAAAVPGKGSLPPLLAVFPKEGLVARSERYVRKNFLGYEFLHDGYTAAYTVRRPRGRGLPGRGRLRHRGRGHAGPVARNPGQGQGGPGEDRRRLSRQGPLRPEHVRRAGGEYPLRRPPRRRRFGGRGREAFQGSHRVGLKARAVNDRKFFQAAAGLVLLFALGIVAKAARSVLFPFILAVFISYVIDPVVAFLLKAGLPKAVALGLILAGAFVFLYFLGAVVYASGKTLAAELPRFEQRLTELAGWLERTSGGLPFRFRLASVLDKVSLRGLASLVLASLGPFVGLVSKLLVLFVFLVFIVAGRGRFAAKVGKAFGPERAAQVLRVSARINAQIRKYLVIKTLTSLLNGLEVWLVLELFRVDFALLFGFLAFLLNYIPNIGSTVAVILRVGFAYFQFGTPWVPLWVLVITVALDMAIGNWVEPKVMGKGLGLSPLVVLFSLVLWGWLWGIPGMIMAVPLMAVIRIVCQNIPSLEPAAVLLGP